MIFDTWIISESDEIAASIRQSLQKLNIECPLTRVITAASTDQLVAKSVESAMIVFFAASCLTTAHLELLGYLRSATRAKVVFVAPLSDQATVLKAIRAGASDFLNAEGNLDDEIADLLSRFKSECGNQASKGRLITIVPCHVPSDASILAVNISAAIAQKVGSCGLLDFHLRGGDLAMLLKLSPRHTVYDLITQRENIDEAMFQQALTKHESGIRLLAGPPLFSNLGNIQPHVCHHLLELAQASHPFVVVNSEDVLHAEQVRALASSDLIVMTMRMDLVSLHHAQQHLAYLRRNHVSLDHIHLVAMCTGHQGEVPVHSVEKILGAPVIHCITDDPVATTMSINVGNPLILEAPNSKASRAIVKFAETLTGQSSASNHHDVKKTNSKLSSAAMITLNVLPFFK